jgi:hypothetical protein
MKKLFINNLNNLRKANKLTAGLMFCFSLFPMFFGRVFVVTGICIGTAIVAVIFASYLNYKMQIAI